jgi:hypothetical protein
MPASGSPDLGAECEDIALFAMLTRERRLRERKKAVYGRSRLAVSQAGYK